MSGKTERYEFFKNFSIGGFAGGISRTVTSPLEITKMLQQNYPNNYGKQRVGTIIKKIYAENGIKSLFKGNLTNCLRIVPQNAIQLSFYNYFGDKMNDKYPDNSTLNRFLAGSLAGVISYSVIYPLETARSKLSVDISNTNKQYSNLWSTLKHSAKTNGFRSLYNGWLISSLGMIPYQGITFSTYGYLKDKYNPNNDKLINLPIGSIASLCAVTVTYPCDVIKRKYHLSGEMGNTNYKNYPDLFRAIYKESGMVGFYRGILSCYLKMIPSSAIFFFTIELFK
jgi:solute carrier family 25 (mitochondrial phosphate transporter), member 23/24/25/41